MGNLPVEARIGQAFSTPATPTPRHRNLSLDNSSASSFTSVNSNVLGSSRRKLESTRLLGRYDKPWMQNSIYKAREKMDRIIIWSAVAVGLVISFIICAVEWKEVEAYDYCMVVDDHFETFDETVWSKDVGIGGIFYGSMDWTTNDDANSYVSETGLHIVPTLTEQSTKITGAQMEDGYTLNLTADGSCTWSSDDMCVRTSNAANGSVINPVRTARLTTAGKAAIQYGRVEVVAKMPKGDWLQPSIWMYPEQETYGIWPRSGEIDIAFIRGNSAENYIGGRDTVHSALHWGIWPDIDQSPRTTGQFVRRRYDLADGFHTYGMEWTPTKFFTWIDNPTYKIERTGWGESYGGDMYVRSLAGNKTVNDTNKPVNIWSPTGRLNTPFDHPFHLVINLAIAPTNGFFKNGVGNKPWVDGTPTAMRDFWHANETWLKSWGEGEDRGMTVKSVKMWQQGKCVTGS